MKSIYFGILSIFTILPLFISSAWIGVNSPLPDRFDKAKEEMLPDQPQFEGFTAGKIDKKPISTAE